MAIEDLSEQQVAEFVRIRGVADHQRFLDQVDQMDAWFLTVRPLDLEELIDYWEANHRIGTRYELMVNSVERRLVEHHQDRLAGNTVSPAMLFNGAKLVAAAATLCHEPKIQTRTGRTILKGFHWNRCFRNGAPLNARHFWSDRFLMRLTAGQSGFIIAP